MEPSEDQISQVIDFASLGHVDDRFMVTQALRSNNCNVETVVMQFFDDPENFRRKYQTPWDDALFAGERDASNNNSGISFHIESPAPNTVIQGVSPPPESYTLGAPSRPPSRSNDRSPLSRMVEWASDDVPGPELPYDVQHGVPNSRTQEDEDIQRAIRESAQEAGITVPSQETGVMGPPAPVPSFGPANRPDYEESSWAMVPIAAAQESKVSEVPLPSLRKRAAGAPAFLIQGSNVPTDNQLGGLLTILHEIPLARNLLLQAGEPANSYGHNSEWWKGQEIIPPHILARLQSGEISYREQIQDASELDNEVHRLMAFLDSTERSYGTVSVLTNLIPDTNVDPERQFYEQLKVRHGALVDPLMQVATLAGVMDDDEGYEDATFAMLVMEHLRSEFGNIKTFYESMDHVMWNDVLSWNELHEGSKMAMFKRTGDVFTVKLSGDGPEDSIDVPLEFYPERYLASRKDEARRIQAGWCRTKRHMAKVMQEEQQIYRWRASGKNQTFDKRDLIKKATEQWNGYRDYLDGKTRFEAMEKSGFDTDTYPDYRAAPNSMDKATKENYAKVEDVIQFSERLLSDLEARVRHLNVELEQIKARQRSLGRLLTVPDKPGRSRAMACSKYLLRGVATSKDVVYVCQRAEADLIELDDEPSTPTDQWWRLAYVPNETEPVKAEKVEVERVLRDMWHESKNPLLIYATEKALETQREPLTSQLERFVKAENKAFRQELNQETVETREGRTTVIDAISPSKRKHRSDSADSMDSNRASLGSDDRNGFDNPFLDQDDSVGTEMTDLSGAAMAGSTKSTDANTPSMEIGATAAIPTAETGTIPPALPARPPMPIDDSASTVTVMDVTPSSNNEQLQSQPAGEAKVETGTLLQTGAVASKEPEVETERQPEMQERVRPPAFMALSRSTSTENTHNDDMVL